jgi:hypothetical protein
MYPLSYVFITAALTSSRISCLSVSITGQLRLMVVHPDKSSEESASLAGSNENSFTGIVGEYRRGCTDGASGVISGKRMQNAMFQLRNIIFRYHLYLCKSLLKTIVRR